MATDELKTAYVQYFADVPIQKYAAAFIGKDEDTIIRWKRRDKQFADAIQKAKANWVRKRLLATKAEFALERLETSVFGPKSNRMDVSVNMPAPIIYFPEDLPVDTVKEQIRPPTAL